MSEAQTEALGIARRLEALAEHLMLQPLTHADSADIATIRAAATALVKKDEELSAATRKAAMLEKSAGFATDDVARLDDENKVLRAQLAEANKALVIANANLDNMGFLSIDGFLDWLREHRAARRALNGGAA